MKQLLVALLLLAGCAGAPPVVVSQAPPAPRSDVPVGTPSPGVFWEHGHYAWDQDRQLYYWKTGRWAPDRPGEVWIPGYWTRVEEDGAVKGWTWVEPRWETAPR